MAAPFVCPDATGPAPAHLITLRRRSVKLPPFLYLDRYRNEGTRTYSAHAGYTECRPEYQPTVGGTSFRLPVWEVSQEQMRVFRADPPDALVRRYLPDDRVLFPVHPQVLEEASDDPWLRRTVALGKRVPPQPVSPGSSTRTLYPTDAQHPHALKVHLPFRVSRYGRRMRGEVVEQAVAVSREIQEWNGAGDPSFAFQREVIGVAHPPGDGAKGRDESWGYLVRDLDPFPTSGGERGLVPGFALYGRDYFDPSAEPLIFSLAESADPRGWLLEEVMLPTVRHWISCFLDLGLILEPHGQNLLLEVDEAGDITRLVHRDLSVGIDMRRRRDVGLDSGSLNKYNRYEDGAFASIAYDRFVGGHFFTYLANSLIARHARLKMEDFSGPVREEFGRLFPDHERYLPRTVRYFSDERDRHGKPLHTDTRERPVWRP